ncbi:MAG: ADOP family duplicated permease [Vicinamibacterales bacterium]
MRWLRRVIGGAHALVRSERGERDLDDELRACLELAVDEKMRGGMSRAQATRAARLELGLVSVNSVKDRVRDVGWESTFDSIVKDVQYGVRTLRHAPGFTITACAALVLGIGLNASLFTLFNAVALRPWPVADPGRVVTANYVDAGGGTSGFGIAEYEYLRTHARTFAGLIAWRRSSGRTGSEDAGRPTPFAFVSGNYFDVLGLRMSHGRGFRPDEDRAGNPQAVAVIGHRFWERIFAGDAAIIGRTFRVDGVSFTVVGVAPQGFDGTEPPNVQNFWVPLASFRLLSANAADALSFLTNPSYCCSRLAGRLAPGVTRAQARAELEILSRQYRMPWNDPRLRDNALVLSGTNFLAQPGVKTSVKAVVALMFTAVILVLLLACANVGNLLLARALARQREFAIRLSLGASRRRVVRQLLTEGFILSCGAGAIAVVVAYGLPSMVVRAAVSSEIIPSGIVPDGRVLVFTLGIAVLSSLLFALAPALNATHAAMGTPVARREVTRTGRRLRSALLAAQLALSVVLLTSATLLVRGVQHAEREDPGFQVEGVFVVSLAFPGQAYDQERGRAFVSDVQAALNADGSLGPVALTNTVPLGDARNMTSVRLPGQDEKQSHIIQIEAVSPAYFNILRIPVVAGRQLEATDRSRGAITINEAMARRDWPASSPIGQTVVLGGRGDRPREIVGVVRNAETTALGTVDPVYYEITRGGLSTRLLLRTGTRDPTARVQAIVSGLDDRVRVSARPLASYRDGSLASSRVMALTAGAVALLALVLASVGVFGVFSYIVTERTREIGIRMAIGARAPQVIRLVFESTAWATVGGLAVGFGAAFVVSRFLTAQLYGMSRFDPIAYVAVGAVLAAAATFATWLPARRATRVDPATALRVE